MAIETLDRDVKVIGFNSDTDLIDKSVRQNQQGVSLENLSFAKVVTSGPADTDASLQRGKILFIANAPGVGGNDDLKLAVCTKSYAKFDHGDNVTLATAAANFTTANMPVVPASPFKYLNVVFTKRGTTDTILGTVKVAGTAGTKGSGYTDVAFTGDNQTMEVKVGDIFDAPAGLSNNVARQEDDGILASGFTVTIASADLDGSYKLTSPLSESTIGMQAPVVSAAPSGNNAGVLVGSVIYDSGAGKLKVCTAVDTNGAPTYEAITSA